MKKKLIHGLSHDQGFVHKIWLTMRLIVLLLFVSLVHVSASVYSQKTKLNLKVENATLQEVFNLIQDQSEFDFFYKNEQIPSDARVSIDAKDETIETILNNILKDKGLKFGLVDKDIVIIPNVPGDVQQQKKVSGKVTDFSGTTLPGVSVVVKGTTIGTITDMDGKYSMNIPDNATLQFSFVGMKLQEIVVSGKTIINVALAEDAIGIEEVVAVGYGTVKKSSLTSAISRVSADDIKDRSKSNVMQSVAGKVAGVQILQTDGMVGYSPTVKIRGTASITAGTTPLYVIDGMPIEGANISKINPSDIESMEILKDASSCAIYGSRGSNGVVIITTKSGAAGKTAVEVNFEHGFSKIVRKVNMMNTQDWIQYYNAAHNNSWIAQGGKASDPNSLRPIAYQIPSEFLTDPGKFGNGTDWQDAVFGAAPSNNVSISVSGGNDKTKFALSSSILSQDGIIDGNTMDRMTFRSNITHKILPNLTVGSNILLTKIYSQPITDEYGAVNATGKGGPVSHSLQDAPIYPLYNENGNYGPLDPKSEWNRFVNYGIYFVHPYSWTREIERKLNSFSTMMNVFLEWKFLNGFTFRPSLNTTLDNARFDGYMNNLQKYGFNKIQGAVGFFQTENRVNWLSENVVTYDKSIGNHSISALIGFSAQEDKYENSNITAVGFPNDAVHTLNAATTVSSFGTLASEWSLLSYFSRLNYSYKGKYLFTSTLRRDGSSRFGKNNKWGYFPSGSIGWRVSEEDFLKSVKWINNLKLRISYGVTGNNLISNYGAIGLLGQSQYAAGNTAVQALYINTISNPDLKWEKTDQWDAGLNLGLFSNRIYLELDYYRSITKDMLLNVPVSALTGFTSQLKNIGKIQNHGFEFSLSTKNLVGNFKWNTDFNISVNRNKVLELGPNKEPLYTNNWGTTKTEIGQPIANFYGYIFDGVFKNQNEINNYPHISSTTPGDPKIRDVNGDKIIDSNDRTTLGNSQPKFVVGFTNTFNFKSFDLSFTLQGQYGNQIMNSQTRFSKFYNGGRNQYAISNNYWKSESDPGDGTIFKPMVTYNGLQTAFSSYWVEDGSFLRIRNLQFGYSLPKKVVSWTHLSSARLYVNIENLHVFTSYIGWDPENSVFASGLDSGNDYGASPMPRTMTFGIKVNL